MMIFRTRCFRLLLVAQLSLGFLASPAARAGERATSQATVRTVWRAPLSSGRQMGRGLQQFAAPLVTSDQIVAPSGRSGIRSFDQQGKLQWQFRTAAPVHGRPILDRDALYCADARGTVHALQAADGHERWQAALDCDVTSDALVVGSRLYVACSRGDLVALDTATGAIAWRTSSRFAGNQFTVKGMSTPVLAGGKILVGFADGKLAALSPVNGGTLWETRIAPRTASLSDVDVTPSLVGNIAYVASAGGGLAAIDSNTGRMLWQQPSIGSTNALLVTNAAVYVTHQGRVHALEPRSGKLLWQQDLKTIELSNPVLHAGRLVVASTTGPVFLLSPDDGALLGTTKISDGTYGPLTVAHDRIFLATNSGHLLGLE